MSGTCRVVREGLLATVDDGSGADPMIGCKRQLVVRIRRITQAVMKRCDGSFERICITTSLAQVRAAGASDARMRRVSSIKGRCKV